MEKTFWQRVEKLTSGAYTRKMLAADSGIAVNTISMWKARNTYPAADIAVRVATSLGTTVEYLVTGLEPPADNVMMVAESPAQGYASAQYSDVIEDLKILDDVVRATFIDAIHGAAEKTRRGKNRQGGSAAG